jgi:hypothetical protein
MRTRLLAFLLALLAGCGEGLEVEQRAMPILNGVPDAGHPAVGMLGNIFCTATLVGSRTVLTAAHCLHDSNPYTFVLGEKTYPAAKVIPHPDWTEVDSLPELPNADWKFSINDIGVLLLADQVLGIEPMRLATQTPAVGQTVTLVGFGVTSTGGGGQKNKVDNVVGNVGAGFVLFGNYGGLTGGDGLTCTGDSGGPALVVEDGEERVLAVHSMAICGKYSQCTRVAPYLDWLAKQSEGNLGVAADVTPPEIVFEAPEPDATRPPDFDVVVAITDGSLRSATLLLDGQERLTTEQARFTFRLTRLGEGDHELKVVALDRAGNRAEATRRVRVRAESAPQPPPPDDVAPASGCGVTARRARGNAAPPLLALVLGLRLALRRRT